MTAKFFTFLLSFLFLAQYLQYKVKNELSYAKRRGTNITFMFWVL